MAATTGVSCAVSLHVGIQAGQVGVQRADGGRVGGGAHAHGRRLGDQQGIVGGQGGVVPHDLGLLPGCQPVVGGRAGQAGQGLAGVGPDDSDHGVLNCRAGRVIGIEPGGEHGGRDLGVLRRVRPGRRQSREIGGQGVEGRDQGRALRRRADRQGLRRQHRILGRQRPELADHVRLFVAGQPAVRLDDGEAGQGRLGVDADDADQGVQQRLLGDVVSFELGVEDRRVDLRVLRDVVPRRAQGEQVGGAQCGIGRLIGRQRRRRARARSRALCDQVRSRPKQGEDTERDQGPACRREGPHHPVPSSSA